MGLFSTKQEKLNKRLFKAINSRNVTKIEAALAEGAAVNCYDKEYDRTPLYSAVTRMFEPAVLLLLEKKADPNFARESGHTCLMESASDGSFIIAQALLQAGARLEDKDKTYGRAALHKAADRGRGDVVKLLMKHGADTNQTDNRMNTAADLADKDHPRLADMIRGKKREESVPVAEAPVVEADGLGWVITGRDEVANVSVRSEIGYRLTEIFNFTMQTYTRIAQNVMSGQESQSLKFFDEFKDDALLDRARAAFEKLSGGKLGASTTLDKPAMILPVVKGNTP